MAMADYSGLINKYAQQFNLDPLLLSEIMRQESQGNPNAVSPKGAQGPMQVMPVTAQTPGFGVTAVDPNKDPIEENIRFGAEYFSAMLDEFNDSIPDALAAYNSGPGYHEKVLAGTEPMWDETTNYIAKIKAAHTKALGTPPAQPQASPTPEPLMPRPDAVPPPAQTTPQPTPASPEPANGAPSAMLSMGGINVPVPDQQWWAGREANVKASFIHDPVSAISESVNRPYKAVLGAIFQKKPEEVNFNLMGVPFDKIAKDQRAESKYLREKIQVPSSPKGELGKFGTDFIDSMINMAPSIAITYATKKPNAGLTEMGFQVFSTTLTEEMNNGASYEEAAKEAAIQVAFEIGPEKAMGFYDNLLVSAGVKQWLKQSLVEGASEVYTESLNILHEQKNKGEDVGDWLNIMKRVGRAGAMGVMMGKTLGIGTAFRDTKQIIGTQAPPEIDTAVAGPANQTSMGDSIGKLGDELDLNKSYHERLDTARDNTGILKPLNPIEPPAPPAAVAGREDMEATLPDTGVTPIPEMETSVTPVEEPVIEAPVEPELAPPAPTPITAPVGFEPTETPLEPEPLAAPVEPLVAGSVVSVHPEAPHEVVTGRTQMKGPVEFSEIMLPEYYTEKEGMGRRRTRWVPTNALERVAPESVALPKETMDAAYIPRHLDPALHPDTLATLTPAKVETSTNLADALSGALSKPGKAVEAKSEKQTPAEATEIGIEQVVEQMTKKKLTIATLKEQAKGLNLAIPSKMRKPEIMHTIAKHLVETKAKAEAARAAKKAKQAAPKKPPKPKYLVEIKEGTPEEEFNQLDGLNQEQLKTILRSEGKKVGGKKMSLVARVMETRGHESATIVSARDNVLAERAGVKVEPKVEAPVEPAMEKAEVSAAAAAITEQHNVEAVERKKSVGEKADEGLAKKGVQLKLEQADPDALAVLNNTESTPTETLDALDSLEAGVDAMAAEEVMTDRMANTVQRLINDKRESLQGLREPATGPAEPAPVAPVAEEAVVEEVEAAPVEEGETFEELDAPAAPTEAPQETENPEPVAQRTSQVAPARTVKPAPAAEQVAAVVTPAAPSKYHSWSGGRLKRELKNRRLPVSGTMQERRDRLDANDAAQAKVPGFKKRVMSPEVDKLGRKDGGTIMDMSKVTFVAPPDEIPLTPEVLDAMDEANRTVTTSEAGALAPLPDRTVRHDRAISNYLRRRTGSLKGLWDAVTGRREGGGAVDENLTAAAREARGVVYPKVERAVRYLVDWGRPRRQFQRMATPAGELAGEWMRLDNAVYRAQTLAPRETDRWLQKAGVQVGRILSGQTADGLSTPDHWVVLSSEEAGMFLSALHSPFRNTQINVNRRKGQPILPENVAGRSGVSRRDAMKYIEKMEANVPADQLRALVDTNRRLINHFRRTIAPRGMDSLGSGLITTEEANKIAPDQRVQDRFDRLLNTVGYKEAMNPNNYIGNRHGLGLNNPVEAELALFRVTYVPLMDVHSEAVYDIMTAVRRPGQSTFDSKSMVGTELAIAEGRSETDGLAKNPIAALHAMMGQAIGHKHQNEVNMHLYNTVNALNDPRVGVTLGWAPRGKWSNNDAVKKEVELRSREARALLGAKPPATIIVRNGDFEAGVVVIDSELASSLAPAITSGMWEKVFTYSQPPSNLIRGLLTRFNPQFFLPNTAREVMVGALHAMSAEGIQEGVYGLTKKEAEQAQRRVSGHFLKGVLPFVKDYYWFTRGQRLDALDQLSPRRVKVVRSILARKRKTAKDMARLGEHFAGASPEGRRKWQRIKVATQAGVHMPLYKEGQIKDMESRAKEIQELTQSWWRRGHRKSALKRGITALAHTMEDFAEASEFGVRLAALDAYLTELEQTHVATGKMTQRAAELSAVELAKDLSVNFQRSGKWGAGLGSLYFFFNPAVGGSWRVGQAMKTSQVRKFAAAGMAASAAIFFYNMAVRASRDDDDDDGAAEKAKRARDYKTSRNMVLEIPFTDNHLSMPLGYGYNFIWNLPVRVGEHMFEREERQLTNEESLKRMQTELTNDFLGAFVPLDQRIMKGEQLPWPSLAQPFQDVDTNVSWTGTYINPVRFGTEESMPDDAWNVKDVDKDEFWQWVSQKVLHRGTKYGEGVTKDNVGVAGQFDVAPGTLKYLFQAYTGGVGTMVTRTMDSMVLMQEGKAKEAAAKAPIVRSFFGLGDNEADVNNRYFMLRDQMTKLVTQKDEISATGSQEVQDIFWDTEGVVLEAMEMQFNKTRSWEIKNTQRRNVLRRKKGKSAEELTEMEEINETLMGLRRDFNRAYYDEVVKPFQGY